ncbi:MAG: hypothetical protein AB7P33_05445 [Dehalococcoidia bacterium]
MELGKRKGEFSIQGNSASTRKSLEKYSTRRLEFTFWTSLTALLCVYFTATYLLAPVFAFSTIVIALGLYSFWQNYLEDVSPQKMLAANKSLRPLAGLALLLYLPILF